ncbi:MAG: gliding motility-associated C-terminal domain-containing protein [Chitinophagales bacterium]
MWPSRTSIYRYQTCRCTQLNGTVANVACFGNASGGINISVAGGTAPYAFAWSNGSSLKDLANVAAGNYSLTVTDANNCTAVQAFTVAQPAAALSFNGTVANVACFGNASGGINISVAGGTAPYAFAWSNGSSLKDLANVAAGNYSLTVTDANNCTAVQAFTVAQPAAALSFNGTVANVACFGNASGGINISVAGGTAPYAFAWSNGSSLKDLANVAAGNYSLTVTDANNCTAVQAFTVAQPKQELKSVSFKTDADCYGVQSGSAQINVTGGTPPYFYRWSNGNNTDNSNQLAVGNYYVSVFDANGCTAHNTIQIQQPDSISTHITIQHPLCSGSKTGAATLTVSGGVAPYFYQWNNNQTTSAIHHIAAGNYIVTVTDAKGCTRAATAAIQAPNTLILDWNLTNNICANENKGSINTLTSGGVQPYNYTWSNQHSTPVISNLANGNYTLTVTDKNGCTATKSATITSPSPVEVVLTISGSNSCQSNQNISATALASGGTTPFSYLWHNGSTNATLSNIAPNSTIQVIVKDKNGCIAQAADSVRIALPLEATVDLKQIGCQPNATGWAGVNVQGGAAPYRFAWSNGGRNAEIHPSQAGVYHVTVTDKNGCTASASIAISKADGFTINTIAAQTITLGESIELTTVSSSDNIQHWNWTPDDFNSGIDCNSCQSPNVQPKKTTTYLVTAIDENGCIANDTVTISIIADHTLFVPNTFSPNNDGSNDTWGVFGNLDGIKEFDLKIFNRWGEKVYESSDPHFQWNGTYLGVLQEPGVFVYYMKVIFVDGLKPEDDGKGSITLIR